MRGKIVRLGLIKLLRFHIFLIGIAESVLILHSQVQCFIPVCDFNEADFVVVEFIGNVNALVVGSNVANSLSSESTPAPVRVFNNVDLPALV